MRSKTFSFNKEIIKQDFRNVGWISIVYFLGLFFLGPMQLFMVMSSEEPRITDDRGLFGQVFTYELQVFFLLVMPLLMAVFLFRYLHIKGASDFAHSFPVKRKRLFNHHIVSGLILLLVPILLNYFILLISAGVMDVEQYYTISNVNYWLWLFSTMTVLIFMAGVFVGTLTGLSAVQGILTYILLFLPAGLYGLIAFHLSSYINGYSGDVALERSIQYFSPIVDLIDFQRFGPGQDFVPVEGFPLIAYGIAAFVFYVVSIFIYKNRKLESASHALAVTSLNPVFKFGVTFCFALFGGMYFSIAQNEYGWMITGYFIGGTLGFTAATMLLEKTWRVFNGKQIKIWFAYGLSVGIVLAVIPLLWQNYESYVPEENEVEKVFISSDYWQYQQLLEKEIEIPFITSPEGIQSTILLHEQLIEESDPLEGGDDNLLLVYRMEDGSEVYRRYSVDEEKVSEAKRSVFDTDEYKEIQYPVLTLDASGVDQIMLSTYAGPAERELYDPVQIEGFLEALKHDLYNLSYEDMIGPRGLHTNVSFTVNGNQENPYYTSIYHSFERTKEWLKQEGLYEQMMVQTDDIQKAEVYRWPDDQDYAYNHARFVFDRLIEEGREPLEVTGSEKIEGLLQGRANQKEGEYIVALYFDERNPGHNEILTFVEGEAPMFIQEHFE